jgi:hypothetical protein
MHLLVWDTRDLVWGTQDRPRFVCTCLCTPALAASQAAHLSSKAGFADNLMSSVSSIASLALAPLAAWQGQQPQHTRPEQQRQQGPHLQRQHSQSKQHQQQQQQQQQSGGGRGASISSSSGGGKSSVTAAEGGFAVNGGGGMQELVGLDQQGNPLTGLCSPVRACGHDRQRRCLGRKLMALPGCLCVCGGGGCSSGMQYSGRGWSGMPPVGELLTSWPAVTGTHGSCKGDCHIAYITVSQCVHYNLTNGIRFEFT